MKMTPNRGLTPLCNWRCGQRTRLVGLHCTTTALRLYCVLFYCTALCLCYFCFCFCYSCVRPLFPDVAFALDCVFPSSQTVLVCSCARTVVSELAVVRCKWGFWFRFHLLVCNERAKGPRAKATEVRRTENCPPASSSCLLATVSTIVPPNTSSGASPTNRQPLIINYSRGFTCCPSD